MMSVPAFGEWEQRKGGPMPDYSVDFSRIREIRRRTKSHVSFGAEEDLLGSKDDAKVAVAVADSGVDAGRVGDGGDPVPEISRPILQQRPPSPPTRIKKLMSYFNCCGPLGV